MQTVAVTEKRRYTPEEYLALEDAAETRSEYRNGEIIPMTGGTTNHNRISLNLAGSINLAFAQADYEVFMADVKLWIPDEQLYTYPDVMIVAGAVEYHNNRSDIILNPRVLIEVLSKSTEDYDPCGICEAARLGKFALYRTIPSFQEYVLINQTRIQVEHYTKQAAKRWLLEDLDVEDAQIQFASIPFAISLEELYRKVQFDEVEPAVNPSAE